MGRTGALIAGAVVGIVVGIVSKNPYAGFAAFSVVSGVGSALFPSSPETTPPRPGTLQMQTSNYGNVVPVLYGTRKIAGNCIWYDNFQTHEVRESTGGKGGGSEATTGYTYSVSLAFGLCMNTNGASGMPIIKMWKGKEQVDLANWIADDKIRCYDGTQTTADSHMSTYLTTRCPVYKGLVYVVLPNLDLGNSPYVPNLTFEVGGSAGSPNFYCGGSQNKSGVPVLGWYVKAVNASTGALIWDALDAASGNVFSVAADTTGLYACGTLTRGALSNTWTVRKYNLTTGAVIWEHYLSAETAAYSIAVDASGVYVGGMYTNDQYLRLEKLNLSTGAVIWEREGVSAYSSIDDLAIDSTHIYTAAIYPSHDWEIEKRSLLDGTITWTQNRADGADIYDIVTDGTNIYAAGKNGGTLYIEKRLCSDGSLVIPEHSETYAFVAIEDMKLDATGLYLQTVKNVGNYKFTKYSLTDLSIIWEQNVSHGDGLAFGAAGEIAKAQTRDISIRDVDDGSETTLLSDTDNTYMDIECMVYASSGNAANDVSPPDVTNDILTNKLYGLGLASTYWDSTVASATETYCNTNDLLISPLFDSQISVLDALQHVINHHGGYITYSDGKIAHNQLKTEAASFNLTDSDIVKKEGDYPISYTKDAGRNYYNKVLIEYSKRDKEYVTGTAPAMDDVDIDNHGLLDTTVKLDGLTTYSRGNKMAYVNLRRSLLNPGILNFTVGPKSIDLKPGAVGTITDTKMEFTSAPIRIQSVREGKDFKIEIDALEESTLIYNFIATGSDTTDPPTAFAASGDAGNVLYPGIVEVAPLYASTPTMMLAYSKSTSASWAGAGVYRSFASGGTFSNISTLGGSGVTGTIDAIGADSLTITLGWAATLASAASLDELVQNMRQNLFVVKNSTRDLYGKFTTATLVAGNQWTLSGLYLDLTRVPVQKTASLPLTVGDTVVFYQGVTHSIAVDTQYDNKTVYFKFPSYNFAGTYQDISGVSTYSQLFDDLENKPLPPCCFKVNGWGMDSTARRIGAGADIGLGWVSQNRAGTGITNYTRTDAIVEDADFQQFNIGVYDSTTLKRSTSSTVSTWTYSTSMQSSDGTLATTALQFQFSKVGSVKTSEAAAITITR